MKRVAFHELAERELNDAALYYEQERAGLGVKFLDEVERVIGSIIQIPMQEGRCAGECVVASSANFLTVFSIR